MNSQLDLIQKIDLVLVKIRPYLEKDGGNIEFVNLEKAPIDPDKFVAVFRFLGACATCPLSIMTLRAGIERLILSSIPEIKRIEAVK